MKTAIELRDESLEQVEANANAEWAALALQVIMDLAHRKEKINSDDVWQELTRYPEIQTHQPSAMGAIFRKAFNLKLICSTDNFVSSKRPSSHARPIRVWESKLWKETNA
jgi:glucuronate isomerase